VRANVDRGVERTVAASVAEQIDDDDAVTTGMRGRRRPKMARRGSRGGRRPDHRRRARAGSIVDARAGQIEEFTAHASRIGIGA
jgi:hypothetical protein